MKTQRGQREASPPRKSRLLMPGWLLAGRREAASAGAVLRKDNKSFLQLKEELKAERS